MGGARGPFPSAALQEKLWWWWRLNYPLVTIHILRCDLLNVIFARQHEYLWFFAFPNTKKQAHLRLPVNVRKPKNNVSASGGLCPLIPWPGVCPWTPYACFWCAQQLNMVDIWPERQKNYCPPVPWPLSPFPQLQILAPPMRDNQ